jgi:hypothetical protein
MQGMCSDVNSLKMLPHCLVMTLLFCFFSFLSGISTKTKTFRWVYDKFSVDFSLCTYNDIHQSCQCWETLHFKRWLPVKIQETKKNVQDVMRKGLQRRAHNQILPITHGSYQQLPFALSPVLLTIASIWWSLRTWVLWQLVLNYQRIRNQAMANFDEMQFLPFVCLFSWYIALPWAGWGCVILGWTCIQHPQ